MWKADGVGFIVAIDGPAGSGKTTLARRLADVLRLPYLNTGLMYRALAARALAEGVAPNDGDALLDVLRVIRFSMAGDAPTLRIEGSEAGPGLIGTEVEAIVSAVAQHPEIRVAMRDLQRALGAPGGVIEGRDIGTVVFPDADVKFFLLADPEARAARRRAERGGDDAVAAALGDRDRRDARVHPPVAPADAIVLDTGSLDAEQTYTRAIEEVRARMDGAR